MSHCRFVLGFLAAVAFHEVQLSRPRYILCVLSQGDVVWVGRTSTAPTPRIFVKPQDTLTRCHFLHLINEVIDVDDGVIFRVTTKAFTGQEQRSEIAIHIEPNKCTDRALLQEMIRACRHAKEMKELPEKFARVEGICVPHQIGKLFDSLT